jgi:hypothetical protein
VIESRFILIWELPGAAGLDRCMSFNFAESTGPGLRPSTDILLWSERYTVRRGFADEKPD